MKIVAREIKFQAPGSAAAQREAAGTGVADLPKSPAVVASAVDHRVAFEAQGAPGNAVEIKPGSIDRFRRLLQDG